MSSLLMQAAALTGASPAQLKLIGLMFLSLPLSCVFPYLPADPSLAPHLFAALPSVVFLCLVLDLKHGFVQLLASSVLSWLIVKLGVKYKMGQAMPWTIFAFTMGHLIVNHTIRHFNQTGIEVIEITGSQMVLVMKLISFAWSVHDGQVADSVLDPTQRASKIQDVPGLIPFLGYCFYYPSILAGPAFTFASYKSFTSRALFAKELANTTQGQTVETSIIPPGRRRKAAKRCLTGIVYLAIYSMYSTKLSYFKLLDPAFKDNSFAYRFAFMNVAGFIVRTKYYAVWCIAESACILSGLGYNPATKKYDASRNVRIRSIELAPNFKILFDSWNMNTNVWLRECIYKRVTKPGKKPGFKSTQITFITSALWHGINPCYLLTFVLGGFYQSVGRSLRKLVRPFFLPPAFSPTVPVPSSSTTSTPSSTTSSSRPSFIPPPQTPQKWIYDLLGIAATQAGINFIVTPFCVLDVGRSFAAWGSVGYYGIWAVLVPMALLNLGGAKWLSKEIKKRDARAGKGGREEERKMEEERVRWEKSQEEKRVKRGEGVASLGMDVEELAKEEAGAKKVPGKEL
ncbi:hypothetical protein RQP46_007737 [Phenoliferia psychrophenolica]